MFGLTWPEVIVILLGIITVIKTIIELSSSVKDPNIKQDLELGKLKEGCYYKHEAVNNKFAVYDDQFTKITESLFLIKENELKHIENDIKGIKEEQVKIITILEERLPRK